MSDIIYFTKGDFEITRASGSNQPLIEIKYPDSFEAIRKVAFGRSNADIEAVFNRVSRKNGSINSISVKLNQVEKTFKFTLGGQDALLKVAKTDFEQVCADCANEVIRVMERNISEQTAALAAPKPSFRGPIMM